MKANFAVNFAFHMSMDHRKSPNKKNGHTPKESKNPTIKLWFYNNNNSSQNH